MLDGRIESFRAMPLFDQLSPRVKDCLLAATQPRFFSRGETICLQGEDATTLKVVQSGWVKLYRVSPNGDEAVLATLNSGQSFDEIAALQESTSQASAEAVTDCSVLMVNLAAMHHCENSFREINKAVLAAASGHLNDMLVHIEGLKIKTGTQRLSEFLLDLIEEAENATELALPYEKTVLAAKLGMKPESLSRAFRRLKEIGVNSKLRTVSVHDVSRLRSFAQEEARFA